MKYSNIFGYYYSISLISLFKYERNIIMVNTTRLYNFASLRSPGQFLIIVFLHYKYDLF